MNWTADTAFVVSKESAHIALPFLEKSLMENGLTPKRKKPRPERFQPQQPTLVALTFAGVAHAQGTIDLSGAQTLMGTFKTVAK